MKGNYGEMMEFASVGVLGTHEGRAYNNITARRQMWAR